MFKKLINRIRGARAEELDMPEFTLEHCVNGVCSLAEMAKDYDKKPWQTGFPRLSR